jgi:hypothetical protein
MLTKLVVLLVAGLGGRMLTNFFFRVRDWGGMLTIFVGFFISGIGTSFYYSFGVPYLDDNVSKDNSPFMLGENLLQVMAKCVTVLPQFRLAVNLCN